jgi:hypothetical protein
MEAAKWKLELKSSKNEQEMEKEGGKEEDSI